MSKTYKIIKNTERGLITNTRTVRQHMVCIHYAKTMSRNGKLTEAYSYANSIIQCLYYSTPFRENVISFPSRSTTDQALSGQKTLPSLITSNLPNGNDVRTSPELKSAASPLSPGPQAVNSPARRPIVLPGSPGAQTQKPDDKDSPEYRKKLVLQAGPVLDMQQDNSTAYGMPESLFTSLKDIFEAIIAHNSRIGVVSPHKFLEILRRENEMFRSAMHQDAHEFLNLLLNQVVDNVEAYSKQNSIPKSLADSAGPSDEGFMNALSKVASQTGNGYNTHWVHDLFEGTLTSETRCLTCETISQRDEAFMDLSVDLEAHSSVTSCLRKFSEEEMLCERNKFHCDTCGGLQEAEKRMKIKRLPRILALHLKRFKYTEDLQRLQKLFHRVVYPYHLRLFNTTDDAEDPDRLYELYAVVVHIGGGPYHGHYVSIIKTPDRGWLMFDDELVEPVDKSFVRNFFGGEPVPGRQDASQLACAYVLFYQETTLEAVRAEQEAEDRATAARAAEASGVPVPVSPTATTPGGLWGNGLKHSHTVELPEGETAEGFASLAHAATAPALHAFETQGSSNAFVPQMPGKSKKELKREEKERKAAEKEKVKEERKRRIEQVQTRKDAWSRQEEELKLALEASKQSKAEEDARNTTQQGQQPGQGQPSQTNGAGDAEKTRQRSVSGVSNPPPTTADKGNTSGLSRFRHSSMSLRQKPRFLGGAGKDKEKENERLPTTAEDAGKEKEGQGQGQGNGNAERRTSRFGLGRKKTVTG